MPDPSALVRAVLLTSALALAGCIAEEEAPGVQIEPAAEPVDLCSDNTGTTGNVTLPPDNRSGNFNAFCETNATEEGVGGVDHHHDYWLGRDRVDIFAGHAMMDPQPDPEGSSATFGMPAGALVYEGTASFEFLVKNPQRHVCEFTVTFGTYYTCTDGNGLGLPAGPPIPDPAPPTVRLMYIHASASEWIDAGELAWGTPLVIPVKPIETDMPHSTTSLWRFQVVSADQLASTLEFDASATIVRGEDVPLWPAHPDFYKDKSRRVIYEGPASTREAGFAGPVFNTNDSLEQKTPGRLISYGTKSVYVWINVTKLNSPPGFGPTHWYLYFHNATGDWYATDLRDENLTVEKTKEMRFVLPVSDDGMDSPYAPDSRWEFLLRGTKELGTTTCYGGCATYAVEYTMTIIATNQKAETYTPTTDA